MVHTYPELLLQDNQTQSIDYKLNVIGNTILHDTYVFQSRQETESSANYNTMLIGGLLTVLDRRFIFMESIEQDNGRE